MKARRDLWEVEGTFLYSKFSHPQFLTSEIGHHIGENCTGIAHLRNHPPVVASISPTPEECIKNFSKPLRLGIKKDSSNVT
jgi:hypothetical protein